MEALNEEIFKIREIILKKINHPYTPITDFESELLDRLEEYEAARTKLQQEIEMYNEAVKRIGTLKRNLASDNAAIAHYEISRDADLWKQAIEEQKKANEAFSKSNEKIRELKGQLNILKSRKKNIKIAVNLINKSLRYVFFSKDRLEIKVEDEKYVLYAHGKPVTPNNISVGERNIIALCYFFTELIMNQEAKDGYSKKIVLVIDDPISSFDFENKVGIMSLLKIKVSDIIMTNPESQILIMTHDIQCLYDLQKIADEVSDDVSLTDMDYLGFLSEEERQRTAREVICFIYLLNDYHVLAHLDGKKNIITNIQKWCADIKGFCVVEGATL